jgi:hypothetical protein
MGKETIEKQIIIVLWRKSHMTYREVLKKDSLKYYPSISYKRLFLSPKVIIHDL